MFDRITFPLERSPLNVSLLKWLLPRRLVSVSLLLAAAATTLAFAQDAQPAQAPLYGGNSTSVPTQQQSGSATSGVFAPILDSENRPITAGGFVKDGPVVFNDISQQA